MARSAELATILAVGLSAAAAPARGFDALAGFSKVAAERFPAVLDNLPTGCAPVPVPIPPQRPRGSREVYGGPGGPHMAPQGAQGPMRCPGPGFINAPCGLSVTNHHLSEGSEQM